MEYLGYFLGGAIVTFLVSITGGLLGVPLGLLIGICRARRIPFLSPLLSIFVSFVRSLPLLLFVMLFYFGLPIFGINLNPFVASIIALALNDSAFASEIWRSAIVNFSPEQLEAAKAFGMTNQQAFWRVSLPQIWRASIPALTSDMTLLIKASPAIGIIGVDDLTRRASILAASNYEPLRMLTVAMVMYIVVLFAFTIGSKMVDKRLQQKYELI